jgi:AbrB family looped-hinge helix DNA binding protein
MDRIATETTRMSTKGQVVIPEDIRDSLNLARGTQFIVLAQGDTVILKKIGRPSKEEVSRLFKASHAYARKMGFTKSDLDRAIREVRAKA